MRVKRNLQGARAAKEATRVPVTSRYLRAVQAARAPMSPSSALQRHRVRDVSAVHADKGEIKEITRLLDMLKDDNHVSAASGSIDDTDVPERSRDLRAVQLVMSLTCPSWEHDFRISVWSKVHAARQLRLVMALLLVRSSRDKDDSGARSAIEAQRFRSGAGR